jgi:N-acetylmuramoyl-L-alanine amidase
LCFDPGHGLPDPGAVVGKLKEYQLTFDIATRTASYLGGYFNVIFTRTAPEGFSRDETEDLAARVKIANASQVALVISFHINAGGGSGPEVFVLPGATDETRQKAQILHDALASVFGTGRGINDKRLFYILRYTKAPAILLEIGFIDNPKDANKLINPAFRDSIALALADALIKIFGIKNERTLFQDVNPADWFYNSIDRIAKAGIMNGYPDGSFKPDQPPSRAEMAAALDKLLIYLKGENWYAVEKG